MFKNTEKKSVDFLLIVINGSSVFCHFLWRWFFLNTLRLKSFFFFLLNFIQVLFFSCFVWHQKCLKTKWAYISYYKGLSISWYPFLNNFDFALVIPFINGYKALSISWFKKYGAIQHLSNWVVKVIFFFSVESLTMTKMDRLTITQCMKIIKTY